MVYLFKVPIQKNVKVCPEGKHVLRAFYIEIGKGRKSGMTGFIRSKTCHMADRLYGLMEKIKRWNNV